MAKETNVIGSSEFAVAYAKKLGKTQKEAKEEVKAVLDIIQEEVGKGNTVNFIGFGKFEVRERSARKGRNPQTGKEIKIKASKAPAFKAGAKFKEAVK